ncbi:MAG: hypothetical protein GY884_01770 [Proteobacteria bacterium]|nr:hypothetical protein [Pseudomonadota bacterium]
MASLSSCPRCRRTLKKTLLGGAYFPVYTCLKCKTKYCSQDGDSCPKCGATARGHYDDVYAR